MIVCFGSISLLWEIVVPPSLFSSWRPMLPFFSAGSHKAVTELCFFSIPPLDYLFWANTGVEDIIGVVWKKYFLYISFLVFLFSFFSSSAWKQKGRAGNKDRRGAEKKVTTLRQFLENREPLCRIITLQEPSLTLPTQDHKSWTEICTFS